MSSIQRDYGGIVFVGLGVLLAVVALLAASSAGPVIDSGLEGARSSSPLSEIPSDQRPQVGGYLSSINAVPVEMPAKDAREPPGPGPMDFPFDTNVAVWTDAGPQRGPSVASDSQGRIYVAFEHEFSPTDNDVMIAWSDDGGRTWAAPVPVAASASNERNPALVITTNDILTVFFEHDFNPAYWLFAQSSDRGNTWLVDGIDFTGLPFQDFRFPSFVAGGLGAFGISQMWCTDATSCGGGAMSVLTIGNDDVTDTTWFGFYFTTTPDFELFHPAAGFNSVTGEIVGVVEYEVTDNLEYDIFGYRFLAPTVSFDESLCGTTCASSSFVWPTAAVDGNRILAAGHFVNSGFFGVAFPVVYGMYSTDGAQTTYRLAGSSGRFDMDPVEQRHVSMDMQGAQVVTAYRKGTAVVARTSSDGGVTFVAPVQRVSDNTPGTAIDLPHGTSIASSSMGPLIAWHDNRDGNANIYFATYVRLTITIDTSPIPLQVRFDGGTWQTAPASAQLPAATSHTIEAQSPQPGAPGVQYVFAQWTDGNTNNPRTITVSADATYVASFRTQFEITVDSNPPGRTVTVNSAPQTAPYVFWCDDNSVHTISATTPQATGPGTRYRYESWSDGGGASHQITCTGAATITGTFVLQYQITIGTNPPGRAVTVDGLPQTGPYSNWWDAGSTVGLLVPSPQTVGLGSRYSFSAWSDGNVNPSRALLADQPRTLTAIFTTEYFLTISTTAGTVSPGNGWHPANDIVAIQTNGPADGLTERYRFGGWTGDLVWYQTSTTINMDGPKTITANWVRQYKFDIRFGAVVPAGNLITIDGQDVAPNVFWWNESSSHDVGVPAILPGGTSDTRYNFVSWQGAGSNRQFTVTVSGAATYVAQYTRQFLVTLIISPTGPAVTVDGTSPTGALWFDEGTVHAFDAGAAPQLGVTGERFRFSGWSGAGTGTSPSVTITMDAPKVLTATYVRQYLLTIDSQYGNPTCASPGVAVTGGCWYDEGLQAQVTVTTPAPVGGTKYKFTGWSGAASTAALTATVTMDGAKTLTASWAEVTFLEEFGLYLGILIAILVAVILLVLFLLMRRRRKEPSAAAMPPPIAGTQAAQAGGTKMCPACGMEIPGGATACPVCGSAV